MVEPAGDGGYLTNFGAIAAARDLRVFDTLQRKRIRVIRYRGLNKVETIDENIGQKGYAIGFEGLIGYLKRVLPHSEVIREALRAEVSVYPEIALRELIANALIHQDFTISGVSPMIEIFDDRIEFSNPGGLLPGKTVDRLIGATPQSRNETLAAAFRRFRICEERALDSRKQLRLSNCSACRRWRLLKPRMCSRLFSLRPANSRKWHRQNALRRATSTPYSNSFQVEP